jgi:hypothetical protein
MSMKVGLSFLFALFLLSLLAGCSDECTNSQPVKLNQSIKLSVGTTVSIEDGSSLKFTSVDNDSRCPPDAFIYCFWRGVATLKLSLTDPQGDIYSVSAPIFGYVTASDTSEQVPVRAGDYELTVQQLVPGPDFDRQPPIPYEATILIRNAVGDYVYPVTISDLPLTAIQIAPFRLDTAYVAADTLDLSITHGGGCEAHFYFLYMSPAVFSESNPAQAEIYLQHIDNGDACDALLSPSLKFDLTPIAELYDQTFGHLDQITLNVHEFLTSDSGRILSVAYDPIL